MNIDEAAQILKQMAHELKAQEGVTATVVLVMNKSGRVYVEWLGPLNETIALIRIAEHSLLGRNLIF